MAENFVCVRIQSMNGVNINHFQFEYDLTWMAYFQNAEGRTYIRYGGREDDDPESYLTKNSLLRVMRQVLVLHEDGRVQPDNRYEPVATSVRTPADIPPMQPMIAKRNESCIHCHDVKLAQLMHLRDLGRLRKEMVFTYPSPSRLGLRLLPDVQYQVQAVDPNSPAEAAGIRAGDLVRAVDDHRVLTFADITRVLELAPEIGTLPISLERNKEMVSTELRLPAGWRRSLDPSWRQSTGVVGPNAGMWGVVANDQQRRQLGLGQDDLALRVTFIHQPWSRAAGLKLGDYLISIDGQKSNMNARQVHTHLNLNKDWGDTIELVVRRDGKDLTLTMRLPASPPD